MQEMQDLFDKSSQNPYANIDKEGAEVDAELNPDGSWNEAPLTAIKTRDKYFKAMQDSLSLALGFEYGDMSDSAILQHVHSISVLVGMDTLLHRRWLVYRMNQECKGLRKSLPYPQS